MVTPEKALTTLRETAKWGHEHGAEEVQGAKLDIASLDALLADYEKLTLMYMVLSEETVLSVYLHDRYNIDVRGNMSAIGRLRDLLIPLPLVKGFVMTRKRERVDSANYTQLKERREALSGGKT